MKTLILVLIILSFIQTTILHLDLVLIILICRAYLKTERANLYLAFGFGLLVSFLRLEISGLDSIIYLTAIQLTQMFSKSPLASRSLLIIPVTFAFLSLNQIINSFIFNQTLQFFPKVIIESFLSLPVLFLVKLWEERFIVKREIKLRV